MIVHVMTFNIRGTGGILVDGVNAWGNRRKLNVATIQKYSPDILGFQEAKQGNIEAYADLSDYNSFLGLGAAREHGDEYNPIYWKSSLFERIEAGHFYLGSSPYQKSTTWDSNLERVAAWVKLRHLESQTVFFVLNTHFPHEAAAHESRHRCARLILQELGSHAAALPLIVMGDFNAIPDSAAYRSFLDAGLVDSFLDTGAERDNTFHNFEGEHYPRDEERIDWILTKGFAASAYQVIRDAEAALFPSDHYPVLVRLVQESDG